MTISASVIAADLINDYIDGRWDRIDALHQKQLSSAINRDIPSVLDLLAYLSPGRVLADATQTSPGGIGGFAPSQQVLISTCRGQLLQALASLSMGDTAQANASSTAFCASLSSLLDDDTPELTSPRVVLRLVGPAKLCRSLRFFQRGRIHQLAGDLPARMTMVLGMHRSGTSALSGMLQAAGLQAPSDVLGASAGNPLGYWESRRLVGLTDRFLNSLGCSWSQLFLAPRCWMHDETTTEWVAEYLNAMAQCFDSHQHIVLKDPRLCLLLSPLCSAWFGADVVVDYLLMLRSPIEVISSLTAIHPISQLDALCLWIASVLNSERQTRHLPRRVVAFPELLCAPKDVLSRCRSLWGPSFNEINDDSPLAMIDGSLHRQKALQVREQVLSQAPQLDHLLDFADLVYDALMHVDRHDGPGQLDGLNQVWSWERDQLIQSALA